MKIKKCIMPIAGRGTRFLPITKAVSKEMLPIVNKPNILLQVEECYKSGIEEIIFVVGNHNYKLVEKFFSSDKELEKFLDGSYKLELLNDINELISHMKIHFVMQDENIRGTAGAIYAAREYIDKDEYFAVMFGDDLVLANNPPLKKLIDAHSKYNCNIAGIGTIPNELLLNYGLCKFKKDNIIDSFIKVKNINEIPSNKSLLGRLIVHSTVFSKILEGKKMSNNEYGLPGILVSLDEDLRGIEFTGEYFDIGSPLGYIKANIAFGMQNDKIKKELQEYIDNLKGKK